MSCDQFFGLLKLVFLSKKTKIKNDTILANYKKFVSPKNQLILQKTVKKISDGSFFKEKYGSGGAIKFLWSPITRVLRTCRSQKQFSRFYSSSNDISLTLKFDPFWWRQPLWRHNLTFWVKQKLTVIWSTTVVYLASLVKKWKEM